MRSFILYLVAAIAIIFYGCRVSYSFSGASIPIEAKTVSIADFPNVAPLVNPLLSNTLTEALRDKFMNQTSLQIVQYDGDLQFTGTITQYNTKPMNIEAGSDQAAQNRLTIGVKIKFTNKFDPKSDFESSFSQYDDYDSNRSFQEVENDKVEIIVEKLVEDIFNKSVVNW